MVALGQLEFYGTDKKYCNYYSDVFECCELKAPPAPDACDIRLKQEQPLLG